MSLSMEFRGLASCNFGDGTSVSFWDDTWDLDLPQLFSFAKNPNISVAGFLSRDIETNFLLPLSIEASMQLTELAGRILEIHANEHAEGKDHWTYLWGANFTCKQAYLAIQGAMPKQIQFTWLWKSSCRGKHKFFFWLLLLDSCNKKLAQEKAFHFAFL